MESTSNRRGAPRNAGAIRRLNSNVKRAKQGAAKQAAQFSSIVNNVPRVPGRKF